MEDAFGRALGLLRPALRRRAEELSGEERLRCEELRLRRGQPLTANLGGREFSLGALAVEAADIDFALEKASGASLHSVGSELRRGYLAVEGGLRLGLCGRAVAGDAGGLGLREISSLAIRIPRAHPAPAQELLAALRAEGFPSALLLSPPGAGKTSLLRELIRGAAGEGLRVCVADERGELAGAWAGGFAFELGAGTDVMTAMPKAAAVMAMLRSMNPQVIALDEITEPADARALLAAAGCGLRILATVHGKDRRDLERRPALRPLLAAGLFEILVTIEQQGTRRQYRWERL